jgi:tetratricopeptide (TPR) repeat protein
MFRLLVFSCIIVFFSCSEGKVGSSEPKSISELSKALLQEPNDTVLLKQRRDLFISNGILDKAILDQQQLYNLDSTNLKYRYDLAEMYFELSVSNPSYVNKSLNLLTENNMVYSPMLLLRAKLHYIFQDYSQSLVDFNTYLPSYPFNAEAYFYKGLNYKEMGDLEMAKSQFQTAVEQDPNYIESYEQLAFIYAFNGDSLAEYYFDNALEVDSSLISSWYNKGMYHQNEGDFSKAKASYYGILRRDSLHSDANYNLGYISLVEGDYNSSIDYFTSVIVQNPSFASAYFSRGLAFKLNNDLVSARKDFLSTLELSPEFKEAEDELKFLP